LIILQFYTIQQLKNCETLVTNLSGKIIGIIVNITGSIIKLDRDGLSAGVYLLYLRGPENYKGKLVV